MCSTNGGRLRRICQAIDELAASSASGDDAAGGPAPAAGEDGTAQQGAAQQGAAQDGAAQQGAAQDGAAQQGAARGARRDDPDIARLAAIWEMMAAADPELAKRLPGYLSAAE